MGSTFIYGDPSGWTDDDILTWLDDQWKTLSVPASRIVGKKSSGNLAALSVDDIWSMIGGSIVTHEDVVVVHEGNIVTN